MHIYTSDNGIKLPSVTTIIHSVLIDPDPLLKWSNIMGFKHKKYESIMDETSSFGTKVHEALEKYMSRKDDKLVLNYTNLEMWRINQVLAQFDSFCNKNGLLYTNTMYTELTSISETLGFAGTMDWVGTYKDKVTLIDYKTSKVARLPMFIQLSAYMKLLEERGIYIEQGIILTVNETKITQYVKTKEELDKYYELFIAIKEVFNIAVDMGIIKLSEE